MEALSGLQKVLRNLQGVTPAMVDRVATATEKTAVLVANHAKGEHDKGFAHAVERYENQTTNLTNSIMPELTRADSRAVEAIVHTNKQYAPYVEFGTGTHKGYPFMQPAMISQKDQYKERVRKAIHGNA